jgi:hypothetical protein
MRKYKLDKISKIAIKVLLISIISILIFHLILDVLARVKPDKSLFRAVFYIGYIVIYASICLTFISLVVIIVQLLRKLIKKQSS